MDNLALGQGGNIALASGALATGTTTSTVKTTVAVPFLIDGLFYSKAITDNMSIAISQNSGVYGDPGNGSFTGGANGSTRLYGLFLDTAGALSAVPGPIVDTAALAAGSTPLQFPPVQRKKACIGFVRIALTSGTTFIPGTTLLGAAGVTTTYLNAGSVPAEPLTA